MKASFKLLASLLIPTIASDCSLIHSANPEISNSKCCNRVLYGIQCASSRVVQIDDSDLKNPSVDYTLLLALLGLLTELTEIRISTNVSSSVASLPPNIGKLSKQNILAINVPILTGSLPPSISNCSKLRVL